MCHFFSLKLTFKARKSVFWKVSFAKQNWLRVQDFVYKTLGLVRISVLISTIKKSFWVFLHNSSYDTKAEVNELFYYSFKIIPSLKTWLKHAYLHRSIDVKFIFNSARLGLFSSANILQIADVALRVVFLLFLPCFKLFLPSSYSWNEWNVRHFSSSRPKQLNLVPRSSRLTVH